MPKAKGEIKKWQGVQTQDKWIFPLGTHSSFCLNRYWLGEISSFLFPASTARPFRAFNKFPTKDNKLVLQGRGRGPEALFISQHSHQ